MKVAILSSATGGGAGIAASRIADALRAHGHEVQQADASTLGAVAAEVSPQVNVSNGRLSNTHFTADFATASREWCVRFLAGFDVVNVHWSSYLLSVGDLQALADAGVRLLLTMHDFNPVTGGCHYPAGCTGLFRGCEACPQVEPELFPPRGVAKVKARKMALLRYPNVHLCAPSRYVMDAAARASGIPPARLHLIRNPYTPLNRQRATSGDRPFTVLLVADSLTERRKGAALASEALQRFVASRGVQGRKLRVHVAGAASDSLIRALRAAVPDVRVHGRITNHADLVALYAESDVQLLTSFEDNWPNVLCEAGAYGCLAVVGPGHGCEEFLTRFNAGAMAQDYSPQAFAAALVELASLDPQVLAARQRALTDEVIREHDSALIASQYTAAFEHLMRGDTTQEEPSGHEPPLGVSVSSNFLGIESRIMLAAPHPAGVAQLEVSRAGAQACSGVLTLHAVYGDAKTTSVVQHAMTGRSVVLPLQGPQGSLRHVFAQEQSDYGLTALRCALSGASSPSKAGSSTSI
jgi:glycosyltransferase involved in cell wall biosynthesis